MVRINRLDSPSSPFRKDCNCIQRIRGVILAVRMKTADIPTAAAYSQKVKIGGITSTDRYFFLRAWKDSLLRITKASQL